VACSFRRGRQEDAHEYLRGLIDALHEAHVSAAAAAAGEREPLPAARLRADTAARRVFGGVARSQIVCDGVDYESSVYEPFLDLSLELVRCGPERVTASMLRGAATKRRAGCATRALRD
jgi:ubiquitin carboxyl-terminal hydrolase 36/42